MYGTAKHLKDKAAAARRTATALRGLATSPDLEHADQGLLLKAAQVLEGFGARTGKEAKARKAAEEAREKAIAKATLTAAKAMADWPQASVADKVALICAAGHRRQLIRDLGEDAERPAALRRSFDYWLQDAIRDLPATAAYHAVSKSQPIEDVLRDARAQFDVARASQDIVQLAQRFALCFPATEQVPA